MNQATPEPTAVDGANADQVNAERKKKRSSRLLAALFLLTTCLPLTSLGVPKPAAEPPPAGSLFLHAERFPGADGKLLDAERGLLFVPQNRSKPNSAVLSLEFYRFAAAPDVPTDRPPIFVLNGGPGFPGLEGRLLEDPSFYEQRIAPQTEIADVVVVGQRGIGSSRPNTICDDAAMPYLQGKNCREFWEERVDLQGFTALEAAADVRDLAQALGYEKVSLLGGSFGSHWSMAVMREHPEIVARAVLHGMEGPDHTYDSPTGVLNALRRMATSAEASERLREHIPEGGLIASFERVMEQARKGPVIVSAPHPTTGEATEVKFLLPQIQRMIMGTTRRVGSREGIATWPADLIALANGDFERAARVRLEREAASEEAETSNRDRFYRTASYYMLDCGSGITKERLAELQDDPAIALVGNLSSYYQGACGAWDADLGDEFRRGSDTDIPTLIVHGNWDISTPYENATELAPRFSNSRFVTVEGGTHGALGEALEHSEEFRNGMNEFLRSGSFEALPEKVTLPEIEWEVP